MTIAAGPFCDSPMAGSEAHLRPVACGGRASRMMNGVVSTQRRVKSKGATGEPVVEWVEHITSVCASLQVARVSESMHSMREAGETALDLYTPPGVDIVSGDRVVPRGSSVYAGLIFEVESTQADDAGRGAYARFSIRRLEGTGVSP